MRQYENGLRLQRIYTCSILSAHLRGRSSTSSNLAALHKKRILPDIESSSLSISRALLPIMHQLKWSIQRDALAKVVRGAGTGKKSPFDFGKWVESTGEGIIRDVERVRLAICPDVSRLIQIYERLSAGI